MKNNFLFSLTLFMLTIFIGSVYAQTVNGTVSSQDGPLPGATVLVKGTTSGVSTDFDGNFSIEAGPDDVLVVSFIGFASKDVSVGDQDQVMVMLESDNELDEVIVTSYASQTRGSVTGSVAVVNMDDAVKTPVVNAAETLQGRVTGVTVVTNGNPGQAPKINIRGFGTSNNTNPLYIIDGVQTDDPLVLNNINPNDIDQMNVLKDGAAAIYGARASNGVVIITTKGGGYNMDRAKVSFDFYTGTSQISNSPEMLNAGQHAQMIWDSYNYDGVTPSHPQYGSGSSPVVPSSIIGYRRVVAYNPIQFSEAGFSAPVTPGGTDWIDAVTQDAPVTNASFSVANGSESARYYFGLGYLDRKGVMNQTGFERGNIKFNSEAKVKDRIKVGQHLNLSYSNTSPGVDESIEGALRMTPLLPVTDADGNYTGVAGPGLSNTRNPAAQLYRTRNDYFKRLNLIGDVYISYDIMDGLTAKTTIAGAFNTFDSRQFTSLDPEHGEPISTQTLNEQNQTSYNWNWTSILNYNAEFGEHSVSAVAGIEAVKNSGKGSGISRQGYLFEEPTFYLLSNGSGLPNVDYAYDGYSTLFSVFANVNYNLSDKYFLSVTIRNDESSRFAEYKSDIFPSFSAGWDISKEDFFPTGGPINYMKLKGSWGTLGNQTLPADNPTINISSLSVSLADYPFNNSSPTQGAYLQQVGNPNLKWETSETVNFGVDLGLLDSKLSISAEYFQIKTNDLITRDFSLISTTAIDAGAPLVNLGDIQNTGFDLSLGYSDATASGLTYDVSFNLSHYKNEVTSLINDAPVFGRGDLRNGSMNRTIVGGEIGEFFGREVTGLDSNGRMTFAADEDGDGDDRKVIGSPHPDFTYGINLNLGYQGFDVAAFFTGSQGNDVYNYSKVFTDFGYFFLGNRSARVLDAWTPSNTNTDVPALTASYPLEESSPNSYFVEDGSFFRLKNLQIGYTLPESVVGSIGADSVRIFLQGTNLFTLTDYQGYDPEVVAYDNLSLGVDARVFPFSKTFTIGTNIKF
jgi:TonB-linked SusC/RagA family outer membrane protein